MSENKTRKTTASVSAFLETVADPQRRADCKAVAKLMQKLTGHKPALWGPAIVGFGSYHYVYPSGREGDAPLTGFSPRAQALTLYVVSGFSGESDLMRQLGPCKIGKSCLYLKRLADVDAAVLEKLISRSVATIRVKYPGA